MDKIPSSEITPEHLFRSRRQFVRGAGGLLASALVLSACGEPAATSPATPGAAGAGQGNATGRPDELGDALTPFDAVTNYNNYYEFTTEKEGVAALAQNFHTSPWSVEVGGLVNKPKTYAIEDLTKAFASEERIYRHRCVEGWSMVI